MFYVFPQHFLRYLLTPRFFTLDYDQILVLENGTLIEFGSPAELLTKSPNGTSGAFRKMCEQSSDWEELKSGVQGI